MDGYGSRTQCVRRQITENIIKSAETPISRRNGKENMRPIMDKTPTKSNKDDPRPWKNGDNSALNTSVLLPQELKRRRSTSLLREESPLSVEKSYSQSPSRPARRRRRTLSSSSPIESSPTSTPQKTPEKRMTASFLHRLNSPREKISATFSRSFHGSDEACSSSAQQRPRSPHFNKSHELQCEAAKNYRDSVANQEPGVYAHFEEERRKLLDKQSKEGWAINYILGSKEVGSEIVNNGGSADVNPNRFDHLRGDWNWKPRDTHTPSPSFHARTGISASDKFFTPLAVPHHLSRSNNDIQSSFEDYSTPQAAGSTVYNRSFNTTSSPKDLARDKNVNDSFNESQQILTKLMARLNKNTNQLGNEIRRNSFTSESGKELTRSETDRLNATANWRSPTKPVSSLAFDFESRQSLPARFFPPQSFDPSTLSPSPLSKTYVGVQRVINDSLSDPVVSSPVELSMGESRPTRNDKTSTDKPLTSPTVSPVVAIQIARLSAQVTFAENIQANSEQMEKVRGVTDTIAERLKGVHTQVEQSIQHSTPYMAASNSNTYSSKRDGGIADSTSNDLRDTPTSRLNYSRKGRSSSSSRIRIVSPPRPKPSPDMMIVSAQGPMSRPSTYWNRVLPPLQQVHKEIVSYLENCRTTALEKGQDKPFKLVNEVLNEFNDAIRTITLWGREISSLGKEAKKGIRKDDKRLVRQMQIYRDRLHTKKEELKKRVPHLMAFEPFHLEDIVLSSGSRTPLSSQRNSVHGHEVSSLNKSITIPPKPLEFDLNLSTSGRRSSVHNRSRGPLKAFKGVSPATTIPEVDVDNLRATYEQKRKEATEIIEDLNEKTASSIQRQISAHDSFIEQSTELRDTLVAREEAEKREKRRECVEIAVQTQEKEESVETGVQTTARLNQSSTCSQSVQTSARLDTVPPQESPVYDSVSFGSIGDGKGTEIELVEHGTLEGCSTPRRPFTIDRLDLSNLDQPAPSQSLHVVEDSLASLSYSPITSHSDPSLPSASSDHPSQPQPSSNGEEESSEWASIEHSFVKELSEDSPSVSTPSSELKVVGEMRIDDSGKSPRRLTYTVEDEESMKKNEDTVVEEETGKSTSPEMIADTVSQIGVVEAVSRSQSIDTENIESVDDSSTLGTIESLSKEGEEASAVKEEESISMPDFSKMSELDYSTIVEEVSERSEQRDHEQIEELEDKDTVHKEESVVLSAPSALSSTPRSSRSSRRSPRKESEDSVPPSVSSMESPLPSASSLDSLPSEKIMDITDGVDEESDEKEKDSSLLDIQQHDEEETLKRNSDGEDSFTTAQDIDGDREWMTEEEEESRERTPIREMEKKEEEIDEKPQDVLEDIDSPSIGSNESPLTPIAAASARFSLDDTFNNTIVEKETEKEEVCTDKNEEESQLIMETPPITTLQQTKTSLFQLDDTFGKDDERLEDSPRIAGDEQESTSRSTSPEFPARSLLVSNLSKSLTEISSPRTPNRSPRHYDTIAPITIAKQSPRSTDTLSIGLSNTYSTQITDKIFNKGLCAVTGDNSLLDDSSSDLFFGELKPLKPNTSFDESFNSSQVNNSVDSRDVESDQEILLNKEEKREGNGIVEVDEERVPSPIDRRSADTPLPSTTFELDLPELKTTWISIDPVDPRSATARCVSPVTEWNNQRGMEIVREMGEKLWTHYCVHRSLSEYPQSSDWELTAGKRSDGQSAIALIEAVCLEQAIDILRSTQRTFTSHSFMDCLNRQMESLLPPVEGQVSFTKKYNGGVETILNHPSRFDQDTIRILHTVQKGIHDIGCRDHRRMVQEHKAFLDKTSSDTSGALTDEMILDINYGELLPQ